MTTPTRLAALTLALAPPMAHAANAQSIAPQAHALKIEARAERGGLCLRSQPPSRDDFDGIIAAAEDAAPSAPPADSARAEKPQESQEKRLGSRWSRALSDSLVPFGLASGAFVLADGRRHRGQLRGAAEGVAATLAATELLKRVVREERPRGGPGSFPSAHASLAFAFATAASYNHRGARLPLFGLATAIAASRVDVRAHHVHDVLAGAALGYFTTRYFMRRNRPSGVPAANGFGLPTSSALAPSPDGLGMSAGGFSFARSF